MAKPEIRNPGRRNGSGYPGIPLFGILPGVWVFQRGDLPPAEAAGPVVCAGAEELIWLVVGLFWAIAQIAGAAAKKKTAEQRRSRSVRSDEDEAPASGNPPEEVEGFADLLRKMSGVEEFKVPEPEFVEDVPEKHPWQPDNIEALPDMSARSIPEADVIPIEQKASIAEAVKEIEQVKTEIRPKMSAFRSSIPSIKLPSMPSMNRTLDVPSYAEASRGRQGIGQELHLKNRRSLRRAMLSHIILSPPKALEKGG